MGSRYLLRYNIIKHKGLINLVIVCFLLGFLTPVNCYSQEEITVSGYVKDSLSSFPMPGIDVKLKSINSTDIDSTITDEEGYFKFNVYEAGNYLFTIENQNFIPVYINLDLQSDANVFLDTIFLSPVFTIEQEIDVFAEKFFIELIPNKRVINIKDKLITKGKKVIDILKMTPYVTVDGEGNIYLKNSESFILQIDGRDVPKQIVESMSADMIDKIEIINNPGAKYSSQAITGVVNILTKEGIRESLFGSINAYGNSIDQYNVFSNLDYSRDRIRIYGNLSGGVFNDNTDFTSTQISQISGYQEIGTNTTKFRNINFRGGIIYDIAKNQSLDVVTYFDYGRLTGDFIFDQRLASSTSQDYNIRNNIEGPSSRYYFSGIYNHFNRDTSFEFDIQLDYSRNNIENNFTYNQFSANNLISAFKENSKTNNSLIKFKSEFINKLFSSSKLEYGIALNYTNDDEDKENDTMDVSSGVYLRNNDFSGKFNHEEKSVSLYSQFSSEIRGINFSSGIRSEYVLATENVISQNLSYENDYLLFSPNIELSYRFGDYSLLETGYKLGFKRPRSYMLNPVERIYRGTDIFRGNPNLNSETIHSLHLSYSKQLNSITILPSINYIYSDDLISIISSDIDSIRTLTTYENINYSKDLNFDLNLSLPILENLFINSGFTLGWQEYNDFRNKDTLDNVYYDLNIQSNITITDFFSLNLGYQFSSDKLKNQRLHKSAHTLNGSIALNFLENKLSVVLIGNDILDTDQYKTEINGIGFTRFYETDFNKQYLALTISYNFGQFKRKKDRRDFDKPEVEEGLK